LRFFLEYVVSAAFFKTPHWYRRCPSKLWIHSEQNHG
jgi:hypothetical protein